MVTEEKVAEVRSDAGGNLPEHERVAIEYAGILIQSPEKIDDTLFAQLKRHYTDSQIIEISMFALNYYKNHAFNTSIDLQPADWNSNVVREHGFGKPKGGDPSPLTGKNPDKRFLA